MRVTVNVLAALVLAALAAGLGGCGAGHSQGGANSRTATATGRQATYHQADTNSDGSIAINEVTAYIAAWKAGTYDSINLVTNAIALWKGGEAYHYDSSVTPPFVLGAGQPAGSLLPYTGSRSYDVVGVTGGGLNNATLKVTVTDLGTNTRATSKNDIECRITSSDGLFVDVRATLTAVTRTANGLIIEGSITDKNGTVWTFRVELNTTASTLTYTSTSPTGTATGSGGSLVGQWELIQTNHAVVGGYEAVSPATLFAAVESACGLKVQKQIFEYVDGGVWRWYYVIDDQRQAVNLGTWSSQDGQITLAQVKDGVFIVGCETASCGGGLRAGVTMAAPLTWDGPNKIALTPPGQTIAQIMQRIDPAQTYTAAPLFPSELLHRWVLKRAASGTWEPSLTAPVAEQVFDASQAVCTENTAAFTSSGHLYVVAVYSQAGSVYRVQVVDNQQLGMPATFELSTDQRTLWSRGVQNNTRRIEVYERAD